MAGEKDIRRGRIGGGMGEVEVEVEVEVVVVGARLKVKNVFPPDRNILSS